MSIEQTEDALIRISKAYVETLPDENRQEAIENTIAALLYGAKRMGLSIVQIVHTAKMLAANIPD